MNRFRGRRSLLLADPLLHKVHLTVRATPDEPMRLSYDDIVQLLAWAYALTFERSMQFVHCFPVLRRQRYRVRGNGQHEMATWIGQTVGHHIRGSEVRRGCRRRLNRSTPQSMLLKETDRLAIHD